MDITTLLVASVVFFIAYLYLRRPDPNLPPFPKTPLPIVGNLLHAGQDPRVKFEEWRKEYGDIFSVYMGSKLTIIVSGYDLLKEILVKRGDEFSDRPHFFVDEVTGTPTKGIVFSSGQLWKEQRTVALSILRDFGMGKNILAEKIQKEASGFLDFLAKTKGKATDIKVITNLCVSNIICSIIVGQRFDHEDETFKSLIKFINYIAQHSLDIVNFLPFLKYIPGDFFHAKQMRSNTRQLLDLFVKKFMALKGGEFVDEDNVDNLIAAYSVRRDKKIKSGQATTMDDVNLAKSMLDLFIAGTETTSTTILWCLIFVLNHPEVQEKIHEEIDREIGTERKPTINDKLKLTYLNVVITETQSLSSLVPLSITHTCPKDAVIGNYTIPKGTLIAPNLDSVLYDKKVWGEDARNFRPDRFIDEHGKIKHVDEFVPFSLGRRVCLGEALAKMELFLFLSFMFQRFKFLPAKPDSPPTMNGMFSIVNSPYPFEIRAIDRWDENSNI